MRFSDAADGRSQSPEPVLDAAIGRSLRQSPEDITRFVEQLLGFAENVPVMTDLEEECPWNQEEACSPKKLPKSVSFGLIEEVSFARQSTGPASPWSPEESRNGNEGGWQLDDEESLRLAALRKRADAKCSRKCVTAAARTMGPTTQLNVFSSGLWRRRRSGADESGTGVETSSARSTPTAIPVVAGEGMEGVSKESCADGEICRQVEIPVSSSRSPEVEALCAVRELEQETKKAAKEDEAVEVDL
ncbi:unnamed protein product [Polarella glacialis]|uniref:Uncharacterized protein n=1 Tax=Polarella glacialis TaxID=89957 RepID=A0A813KS69_POLGL|nr:unnamed protein product [Polarella glacialis]CAE8714546.1 unnamed protein product [Polarella glacialis]